MMTTIQIEVVVVVEGICSILIGWEEEWSSSYLLP